MATVDYPSSTTLLRFDASVSLPEGLTLDYPPSTAELGFTAASYPTVGSPLGYQTEIMGDGPVSYWRFGEASGTSTADLTGLADGTLSGTAALGADGLLTGDPNLALDANGSAGVACGTHTPHSIDTTGELTVESWVSVPATAAVQMIVARDDAGAGGTSEWFMAIDASARLWVVIYNTGGTGALNVTSSALSTGTTYHLAFTWDGTTLRLYVNGTEDGTDNTVSGTIQGHDGSTVTRIGYRGTSPNRPLTGTIDETAIYPRALDASEIAAHYTQGTTIPPAPTRTDEWRLTLVDQDGATICQIPAWTGAVLQEQLNEQERLTVTIPYGTRAAELLNASTQLPVYEVQVWRGDVVRMWGPVISCDEVDDGLRVTAYGAFEHLNRTTCGLAGRRNELTNPTFDGLTGWGVYRSTGLATWGDPTGLYSVVGDQSASGGPPLPPGVTGIVKVNNPLSSTDVVALWQDVPCFAPSKQDMGVYLIFLAWVPTEPALRNSQDLACALSLHPVDYSPPLGWYTEITQDEYGDPVSTFSAYGTIKPGRWVKYACEMTVPAGTIGTIHAVIQTPPGVGYMTLPSVIYDNGLDYAQEDVSFVARSLVAHAQDSAYRKQDRNIDATAVSCPDTGREIDRFYSFDQHPQIGPAITQLTREGLGDWSMAYSSTGRLLRWHYPDRGQQVRRAAVQRDDRGTNTAGLVPGNDWGSASNIMIVQQGSGGFTRAESVGVNGDLGWEETAVTPPETPVNDLYAYATSLAREASKPQTYELRAPAGSVWVGPDVSIGDRIPVVDTANGRSVSGDYRLIRRVSTLDDDTARLYVAVDT